MKDKNRKSDQIIQKFNITVVYLVMVFLTTIEAILNYKKYNDFLAKIIIN